MEALVRCADPGSVETSPMTLNGQVVVHPRKTAGCSNHSDDPEPVALHRSCFEIDRQVGRVNGTPRPKCLAERPGVNLSRR
jgi:hypothetical protein